MDVNGKKILIWASIGGLPLFLMIFALFIAVFLVLGLFEPSSDSSGGLSSSYGSGECGFTISSTSLSKEEYINKIVEYSKKNSNAKVFAENAGNIYDLAVSSNINPELVMVRADVEGYSPGASRNNYWGIGCYNNAGVSACKSYGSFMKGVKGYIDNISKYSSLIDMMSKYAYIGDKWVKGSSSSGGCYYYKYMKDYYANTPEAQKSKQNAQAACAAGGTGIKTTKYDQDAYAAYQVNSNMSGAREKIFGLTDKNSVCSNDEVSASVAEIIKMSDADAWKAITGLNHKPSTGEISASTMDKRIVSVEVPYRTWAKSGDNVIGQVGGYNVTKKTAKIRVNKAVSEVFKAFFTDVYNNAPNFVIRSWDGCYYFRANVNNPSSLSAHAFGVACDINATTRGNRNGDTSFKSWKSVERNVSGKSKYEVVYQGSDVVKIAHKYTIVNGSDWNNPKDAMHFSFIGDKTKDFAKGLSK